MTLPILLCSFLITPHGNCSLDAANSYISRGKIIEDRMMLKNKVEASVDVDRFGTVGVWNWDISSLTGRKQHSHSRFMFEFDSAVFYEYKWRFAEGWALRSRVTSEWLVFPTYREYSAHGYEWDFEQELGNPYLTPYYRIRRTIRSSIPWTYYLIGVKHSFAASDSFSIVPALMIDFADKHGMKKRYGALADPDEHYLPGAMSLMSELQFIYKITDCLKLRATVGEFSLVNKRARAQTGAWQLRDSVYWSVGAVLSF